MSTIFKDIIDKKIKADILYETKNILAFRDINSIAPHHLLIVPKQEIATINDVKDSDTMEDNKDMNEYWTNYFNNGKNNYLNLWKNI